MGRKGKRNHLTTGCIGAIPHHKKVIVVPKETHKLMRKLYRKSEYRLITNNPDPKQFPVKICPECSKELFVIKPAMKYHPECAKIARKRKFNEYMRRYNKSVKLGKVEESLTGGLE